MDTRKSDAIYEYYYKKALPKVCAGDCIQIYEYRLYSHTNARLFVPHDRAKRRTACRRNDSNLRRQRPNHKKT